MKIYSGLGVLGASFLHYDEIRSFSLNGSSLSFIFTDVYLPIENGYVGGDVLVNVENWSDLKILRHDSNTGVTKELKIPDASSILTICECEISESKVIFEGFETSESLWQTYVFINPSLSVIAGID